ncbi:MAG: hypothetical protein ACE15F_10035 [bacterium]
MWILFRFTTVQWIAWRYENRVVPHIGGPVCFTAPIDAGYGLNRRVRYEAVSEKAPGTVAWETAYRFVPGCRSGTVKLRRGFYAMPLVPGIPESWISRPWYLVPQTDPSGKKWMCLSHHPMEFAPVEFPYLLLAIDYARDPLPGHKPIV